jgi:hypothetical protein
MTYDKWRVRLEVWKRHSTVEARRAALKAAGVMNYPQPDLDDLGFYRLPLTEPAISKTTGQPNGRHAVIGYEPVAYFEKDGKLCCIRNGFDASDDEMVDIWTYAVGNPIDEDEYRAMTGETTETTESWGEQA